MGLENIKCFQCQKYGHLAKDCPEVVFAEELGTASDGKPPWCGQCDKRTRLLYDPEADQFHRCPACHVEKDLPGQYRTCSCGNAGDRWDAGNGPYGRTVKTALVEIETSAFEKARAK